MRGRFLVHGAGGIRTLDRGLKPYNGLANRRLQPLGHHSPIRIFSGRQVYSSEGRCGTGLRTPPLRGTMRTRDPRSADCARASQRQCGTHMSCVLASHGARRRLTSENTEGASDGQGGIRTHETREGLPVFKTGAFNHSATCPEATFRRFAACRSKNHLLGARAPTRANSSKFSARV